jgi:hypothetical protein
MEYTVAQIKALSDKTFFNNGQGEIDPAEVRVFNRALIDFIIGLAATFIIDSDAALAAWANNTPGNDYTSVLIRPGTWTSDKEVNLTTAGTKAVTGIPGSKLSFSSNRGLMYDDIPDSTEYWMRGVHVENAVENETIGLSEEIRSFSSCKNLTNCTGVSTGTNPESNFTGFRWCKNLTNCTGTGTGTGAGTSLVGLLGYIHGFRDCTNLTNCTGISASSRQAVCLGFRDCKDLTNCTGTGTCSASSSGEGIGFQNCKNLVNCTGTGTGSIFGFGFDSCRIMLFCKPGATASTTATYNNCYMHATGTTDPVADTAAGGWNRSSLAVIV